MGKERLGARDLILGLWRRVGIGEEVLSLVS
jgi:hypothetical protein